MEREMFIIDKRSVPTNLNTSILPGGLFYALGIQILIENRDVLLVFTVRSNFNFDRKHRLIKILVGNVIPVLHFGEIHYCIN